MFKKQVLWFAIIGLAMTIVLVPANSGAITPILDISRIIPAHQKYLAKVIVHGGKTRTIFTYDIKVDDASEKVIISVEAPDFNFKGVYDNALRLIESKDGCQNEAIIKLQGYDTRDAYRREDNQVF